MILLRSAKNVEVGYTERWIENSPYDHIISKQEAPRVLWTHICPLWLPKTFRYVYEIFYPSLFWMQPAGLKLAPLFI